MQDLVREFFKILPDSLCEDIIDKYDSNKQATASTGYIQIIEKNNDEWKKIERKSTKNC